MSGPHRNPFINPLGTVVDPKGPLDHHDLEEWTGKPPPVDPATQAYVQSYSPQSNVRRMDRSSLPPAVLLVLGLEDKRVDPEETLRWFLALKRSRAHLPPDILEARRLLLLKQPGVGHEGPQDLCQRAQQDAEVILFLESVVGNKES